MSSPRNSPTPITFDESMRDMVKRQSHQARRPSPITAQEFLGPGFAPTAVEVSDWNQDEASFNGMFWSTTASLNSPDSGREWIGVILATPDTDKGIQRVWELSATGTPDEYVRSWTTPGSGSRSYTTWSVS